MTRVPRSPRISVLIGGSSGIGLAAAVELARSGDQLVLAARGLGGLDRARAQCIAAGAAAVEVVAIDVNDAAAVQDAIDHAVETFGRVDVVVHTAAVMAYGSTDDVPAAVWERVVDTMLHGTANVARAVVPTFRRQGGGTLIVTTSLLATVPVPQMGAYITGKWGQLGFLRTLQLELRDEPGIHICTVGPGSVDTPIFTAAANFAGRVGRPPPPVDEPEKLGRVIARLADRPRKHTSVGVANPIVQFGYRFVTPLFDALVGLLMQRIVLSPDPQPPTEGNVFTTEAMADR